MRVFEHMDIRTVLAIVAVVVVIIILLLTLRRPSPTPSATPMTPTPSPPPGIYSFTVTYTYQGNTYYLIVPNQDFTTITIDPGTPITISGTFIPNSTFNVQVSISGQTVYSNSVPTSSSGSFSITIPTTNATLGQTYTVTASGGVYFFFIPTQAPLPTSLPPPQVQIIGPSSVTVGTPIQWQATGFTPNSTLTVTVLNLGTNQVIPIGSYTAASDGSGGGSFITTFQMKGVDYLQVTDSTGRYAFAQFQVF